MKTLLLLLVVASLALLPRAAASKQAGPSPAFPSPPPNDSTSVAQATPSVPAIQGVFGSPITFATHAQLQGYGFSYGPSDDDFGAIPTGGGSYTFYGAAGSTSACAGTPNARSGAFTFTGTLNQVMGGNGCKALFGPGSGPAGWVFDRDYAGGGQIVPFASGGRSGWLMPFHGEFQWQNPATPDHTCGGVPCFYSALGLAVSTDNGKTFQVVGQIMQPSQPLSVFVGGGRNVGVGSGSLVVADANGQHLDNPPADPSIAYFYLFYSDLLPGLPGACANNVCLGVARAPYAAVVAAALSGNPDQVATVFHKYNGASPDPWTQPATSDTPDESGTAGAYAPLWTDEAAAAGTDVIGQPEVLYDSSFYVYLAVYGSISGIKVRASSDLIHWSGPIGAPYSEAGRTLYQPTLLGETGDPTIGGPAPRVYFTSFLTGAFPNWSNTVFESVPLTLAGPSVSYAAGWNLVGGPAGTMLTGAAGSVYTFQAADPSYESSSPSAPLQGGEGYWAYFPAAATVVLPPTSGPPITIALPAGHFIMAGDPFMTSANLSGADTILTYSPSSGYAQTTTLSPGQGAWVFSKNGGALTITQSAN